MPWMEISLIAYSIALSSALTEFPSIEPVVWLRSIEVIFFCLWTSWVLYQTYKKGKK